MARVSLLELTLTSLIIGDRKKETFMILPFERLNKYKSNWLENHFSNLDAKSIGTEVGKATDMPHGEGK